MTTHLSIPIFSALSVYSCVLIKVICQVVGFSSAVDRINWVRVVPTCAVHVR
jgi:hypothetical protein